MPKARICNQYNFVSSALDSAFYLSPQKLIGCNMHNTNSPLILILLTIVSFVLSYFGASVGLVLGNIRLPLLVYALGSPISAVGTNLAISVMGAFAGTYFHMKGGRVNLRLLVSIGVPSMIGAIFSVLALAHAKHEWVKVFIGLILIYSGFQLTKSKDSSSGEKKQSVRFNLLKEGVIGVALGALSGAVGLMLSSIRLPAMIRVLDIEPKEAVGTNLAISFLTGFVGAVTSLWVSGINLAIIAVVAPATLAGSYLGARFVAKVDPLILRKLLTWTLVITGAFMIAETIRRI